MRKQVVTTIVVAAICVLWLSASEVMGWSYTSFTLSDADLMSLDWYLDYCAPDDSNAARIVAKRDIPVPGVEFDVHFAKKNKTNCRSRMVEYVSCDRGGESALAGIDVNDYKMFALKFTLVAVDGNSSPDSGGLLIVGALISNRHNSMTYSTNVISLMRDHKTSVVSSTPVDIDKISVIGVAIYEMDPIGWNPEGTTVTLRIEAAPRAEVLP